MTKREPFGKSIFHTLAKDKVYDMPPISFEKLKKYYDNDPVIQDMMIEVRKRLEVATWQEKLYAEIFHQIMLFGNVIDLDKCKDIIKKGLKDIK